ncbi:30S ribosomal protein S9 [Candidatus Gottesmanbacteria bacterium]|nr:30S ribosomal protein S9 [Candidatus Gottesmanbacteria bacterium]MBI5465578.1 30S ribosomal protein S9 [Candidatus Gottesmanbacteria bacterium]
MKKEEKKPSFYQAVGRRKEATARVRLNLGGNGEFIVNEQPVEKYFPGEVAKIAYLRPFQLTDSLGRFRVTVKVEGGGLSGQLGAVIHGIARALEKIDKEKYRPILKKAGLLTRDPRAKERRKAGFAGKARKKKQSPKR